jgi:GNAT superfamily N-acetyltransferase
MRIRTGDTSDQPIVMKLFDEAVEWLVARGSSGQWGTGPWSGDPQREERVRGMIEGGDLYVAEVDGGPLPDAPPVDEPELYLVLLLSSRAHQGAGIGSRLIEFTLAEARRRGASLVRVDCWSGGDGKLVEYYRSQGFTPTIEVSVWERTVQVFERRL